jgi:hypothetical protein
MVQTRPAVASGCNGGGVCARFDNVVNRQDNVFFEAFPELKKANKSIFLLTATFSIFSFIFHALHALF